jgi:serine/threonine-protein kinase
MPSNILLIAAGAAKLSDFGLAQLPEASGRSSGAGTGHPGTPNYMAPEQARIPEPLAPAVDIITLGCVLFEMLTGKLHKRVRPGTKLADLRPDAPAWLDDMLARALIEDRWSRYESAEEMAAAIEIHNDGAL